MAEKAKADKSVKLLGWAIGIWGVMSIIFGLVVLAWPGITLKAFLIVLGIYLFASGASLAIGSIANKDSRWSGGIVLGLITALSGIFVLANPDTSGTVILYLVALWGLISGTVLLSSGIQIGKDGIWMSIAGFISLIFGFYIFANPEKGALALMWLIGMYTLISGFIYVVAAFKVEKLAKEIPSWLEQ